MKHTTTFYKLADLVTVEITRWPRSREKKIELVLGGEARTLTIEKLRSLIETADEIKKDLGL